MAKNVAAVVFNMEAHYFVLLLSLLPYFILKFEVVGLCFFAVGPGLQ